MIDLDGHVPQIGARVAFDGVQLFGVRVAQIVEPELVVEPDRIHHQRVLVPGADGVPVPGGIRIVGMLAVHEDLPEAVDVAFIQDEDVRGGLCVGVCTMRHGYGAPRGMPNGRQFACGSSCDFRVFMRASAHGCMTTSSPGFSPLVISPELLPPPIHTPVRSTVPSGRRGVGPDGVAGPPRPLPLPFGAALPGAGRRRLGD